MTRFERKILFAILLVALGPLLGSLVLGRLVLQDAYGIGVNNEFSDQLIAGVDARREHLIALRDDAEKTADAVAFGLESALVRDSNTDVETFLASMLKRYRNVSEIRFQRSASSKPVVAKSPNAAPLDKVRTSKKTRSVNILGTATEVVVSVTAPIEPFEQLQRAGQAADVYSRLQEKKTSVTRIYLWAYALMLLVVIAVALFTGVVLSRRVTQRVAALARATRRVGKGDLTVSVPTGATDEVTELTEAFNDMVRDLRDSRARIEYLQRIGAWQDFARRLAHEIKNPLTPIQLAVQEIQETYDGDDEKFAKKLASARAIVEEEVLTLRRLVSEFSAFAKLPQADLIDADMREFIASVESSIPAILEDVGREGPADVKVHVSNATKSLPVRIDPMMLKRCVDNLVRNAVQAVFTEAGPEQKQGEVWLESFVDGRQAVIEIRDNGPGIPKDDWGRVFDPYYTTKAEGTGLGLAIVKKVVLEHGGEIILRHAAEGGACFRIELPMRKGGRWAA